MTRFPTETRDVVGIPGSEGDQYLPYKCPPVCAVPGCTHWTDHAHHLFSRGLMGGAHNWVRLPDGTEVGNLVPLCFLHHELVTNNEIAVTYRDGAFYWDDVTLLSWQPPIHRDMSHTDPDPDLADEVPTDLPPGVKMLGGKPLCITCGRALPHPKPDRPAEEKKLRKTWGIGVPITAQEDGAETLDALVEAAKDELDKFGLDWGEGHKVKYYILTTALALFIQHSNAILGDT